MLAINDLKLLNGRVVNLKVEQGEVVLIKGPNGAGKSLLLKTVARLIPKLAGKIQLDDQDASSFSPHLWRSKIIYLPAEVSFSEGDSVEEYLNEPFNLERYKDFKSTFNPRKYFSDLNLNMSLLSSGQRQRLSILRAMSLDARFLLLDESFSHIDPEFREETFELLKQWKGHNKIIFIVSHFDIHTSQFDTRTFNLS